MPLPHLPVVFLLLGSQRLQDLEVLSRMSKRTSAFPVALLRLDRVTVFHTGNEDHNFVCDFFSLLRLLHVIQLKYVHLFSQVQIDSQNVFEKRG